MTSFDIDMAAAVATVQSAAKTAEGYATDSADLVKVLGTAETTFAHSTLVAAAVSAFMQNVAEPDLTSVSGHTNAALTGTAVALQAYHRGDHTMMATAQRNAAKAEYPADAPGIEQKKAK